MSSIAAGTTTGSALVSTGDTTGELVLKTNGTTTAVTIDTNQNVTIEGDLTVNGTFVGGGDVTGPASSTDNAVALFDGTTGKVLKNGVVYTDANTASTVVQRDASGNFSAGTITAALTGNASTATSAATLTTARDIQTNLASTSAASFDGSANITPGVTGTLSVGNGGTGATTLTANNVILGNGTSAVQFVAPGTSGNVLTSDGTTWVSQAGGGGGSGDVTGPASSTDNAVARFDGTTGKIIQNSAVTIADTSGDITTGGVVLTANGSVSNPSYSASGDTNTGIYFPAADTIGFVCDGTEDFRVDGTGQLWNTVESSLGTDYTTLYRGFLVRAWLAINGSTAPASVRAAGNVSSIVDLNTGRYELNFVQNMPDSNGCVQCTYLHNNATANQPIGYCGANLFLGVAMSYVLGNSAVYTDPTHAFVTVYR